MGAPAGHVDAVGLSEYKVRLPGLQFKLNRVTVLQTGLGYHHADFGSNIRFWGAEPLDSFVLEGSLLFYPSPKFSMSLGSSLRVSRIDRDLTTGPTVFHRTGLLMRRHREDGSVFAFGVAWRNGVALSVIPVLGYEGAVAPGIEASVLLPGRAYVWKVLGEDRRMGLFARYETTPYPGPAGLSFADGILRHRMIRSGLSFEQRVGPTWFIRADLGATFVHDRKIVMDDRKWEMETSQSLVLDVALVYRLPTR